METPGKGLSLGTRRWTPSNPSPQQPPSVRSLSWLLYRAAQETGSRQARRMEHHLPHQLPGRVSTLLANLAQASHCLTSTAGMGFHCHDCPGLHQRRICLWCGRDPWYAVTIDSESIVKERLRSENSQTKALILQSDLTGSPLSLFGTPLTSG